MARDRRRAWRAVAGSATEQGDAAYPYPCAAPPARIMRLAIARSRAGSDAAGADLRQRAGFRQRRAPVWLVQLPAQSRRHAAPTGGEPPAVPGHAGPGKPAAGKEALLRLSAASLPWRMRWRRAIGRAPGEAGSGAARLASQVLSLSR